MSALQLTRIDKFAFMAESESLWRPAGSRAVYGGQVFGLAMLAAHETVGESLDGHTELVDQDSDPLPLHSAHSYFLLPGDSSKPILYMVDPIRDGRSFSTRSVKAIQGGKCIFTATMSFQRREKSVEHSVSAPDAPDPESLPTAEQYLNSLVTDDMSESQKKLIQVAVHMHQPLPLDVRLVNPLPSPFVETPKHDSQLVWIRARIPQQQPVPGEDATGAGMGDLERVRCGSGMESYMHRCIAAFASDWTLCLASLRPHGLSLLSPRLKMLTSIDHSMWYHHPFDATKWMLYQTDSPVAMGGRSLNQGRLFDQQGRLCVSVAQEALVRVDPAATEAGFRA